jgi:hypothetical protein
MTAPNRLDYAGPPEPSGKPTVHELATGQFIVLAIMLGFVGATALFVGIVYPLMRDVRQDGITLLTFWGGLSPVVIIALLLCGLAFRAARRRPKP